MIRAIVSLIRAIQKLRETRDSLALLTRFQRVSRSFYTIARINDTTARLIGWRNPRYVAPEIMRLCRLLTFLDN